MHGLSVHGLPLSVGAPLSAAERRAAAAYVDRERAMRDPKLRKVRAWAKKKASKLATKLIKKLLSLDHHVDILSSVVKTFRILRPREASEVLDSFWLMH